MIADRKSQIDIANVIQQTGVELRRGMGCCPFHDDKTGSFKVYADGYHCFGCGAHGDVIDFVQRKYELTFKQALRHLGIESGPLTTEDRAKTRQQKLERERRAAFEKKVDAAVDYLSVLIRGTYKAASGWKNEKDFADNCEILEPLALLEHYHEILATGLYSEKVEVCNILKRKGEL
jgi:CHC2 zinc finger